MSGHSKWATIHRQKEVKDAKKGQIFTKMGRSINLAVLESGGITDPEKNFKLRLAIEKARTVNMPKENIERAIKKATGEGGKGSIESVTYEGYGPMGVALVIETSTDNKNRTSQEIKNLLEKSGGSLAGPGAVSFQFERVGLLVLEKPQNVESAILKIIDLGALDVEEAENEIEVWTKDSEVEIFKEKIEREGYKVKTWQLSLRPKVSIEVGNRDKAEQVLNLMESLEEHSDVNRVFANFSINDEILANLGHAN